MDWGLTDKDQRVGKLKHFLEALGMAAKSPGQRAKTFNTLLGHAGSSGKLYKARLVGESGKKPTVASEDTFRALYHCV